MIAAGTSDARRSPWTFVALVFALSVPFWVVGAITGGKLSPDLPVGALMLVCPTLAAALLVRRQAGPGSVAALLRRSFDFGRITDRRWWLPVVLLGPGVYGTTYVVMRSTGVEVPAAELPLIATLVAAVAYVAAGLLEELGWSGYAIDPLQERHGALKAGLLLGIAWAGWHLVPLIQVGRSFEWVAWWAVGTIAFRVLLTWIYDNTGKSIAATALVHGLTNLFWIGPFLDFGPDGYPVEGELVSALLLVLSATAVTLVWGPRTLARPIGQATR